MFLLGVGGEIKSVSDAFLNFGEQIFAVGNFTAHLIYDVAVGASMVLRSLSSQLVYNSPARAVVSLLVLLSASLFAFAFRRSNQS